MIKKRTVQPWMLEEATFAIASEHSDFDVWALADGFSHGLKADDAILMSISGGKGPVRLKQWLAKEWFLKAFGEDIIERQTQRLLQRQRSKQD